jgi:iron complex transport system substrate-binding protein
MNLKKKNRWFVKNSAWLKIFAFFLVLSSTQSTLAEIQITDSHGKYNFAEPPKRVVALNWALAEQMLELGETPLGMADIQGFRKHGTKTVVPDSVTDVGERLSPKLAAIRKLKPDIILIGYSQRSLLRPLSNIATVIYFKNFGNRYNNYEKSRERFLEMAKLFDKTALAESRIKKADEHFEAMRLKLAVAFQKIQLPALQIMIPQTASEADKGKPIWVFGKNSLPFYAAKQLGLEVVSPEKTSQFGTAQISAADLKDLHRENGQEFCSVYLPSYQTSKRTNEIATQSTGCSFELHYQNAFGGTMSVLYLSEAIYHALLSHRARMQKNKS